MRLRLRSLIIAALSLIAAVGAQSPSSAADNHSGTPLTAARAGTSLAPAPAPAPQSQRRVLPLAHGLAPGSVITITADRISARVAPNGGKLYRATGHVVISVEGLRLSADAMNFDSASGDARATGHVAFDTLAEQTHIEGTAATYNFYSSTGEFDHFQGVSGIRLRGRRTPALATNPLIFSGRKLERLGVNHYRLLDGRVTSCTLPNPKWTLSASRVDITLGQNAKLYHAVFRLLDVPVFYAPFLTHSTTRQGRHSGVLVPVVSKSNIKGYVLGDSFYWAAKPNLNVTAGTEYYSARGWADHFLLDSRPTRNSSFGVQLDGVFDHGLATAAGGRIQQGGQELVMTGDHETGSGFRSVLDVDYLSSYLYRLVFKNTFSEAINTEAVSTAFAEKSAAGQDLAVVAHRYQDFLGTTPEASLSLAALPDLNWNAYAQSLTRRLPLYFSWNASAGLLDRSQPGFGTGVMERMDLGPHLRLPVTTAAGTFTADLSVRATYYSERQASPNPFASPDAAPLLLAGALWRNAATLDFEWRPPAFERLFSGPGHHRLKHVFEPQLGYHRTAGVDDADAIIRFDDRDILSDTNEAEYGFTNRLLVAGAQPGQSRELASWTLLQTYYMDPTFGGALIPGERNVFLTTEMLSPFDVEALPVRFSPLSSVVRVSPFSGFDGDWRLDYDSHQHQVSASAFSGNFHFGHEFVSGSDYFLRPPAGLGVPGALPHFHQFRIASGYGSDQSPGLGVSGSVAYDARTGQLQYTTFEVSRNWDCCGFALQYRRFSLASVRRENQFLISFTLANVGTFGNLKR